MLRTPPERMYQDALEWRYRVWKKALLTGTGLTVLMLGGTAPASAGSGFGTPAYFAQINGRLGTTGSGSNASAATQSGTASATSAVTLSALAQAIAMRNAADLARAANAIGQAQSSQKSAAAALNPVFPSTATNPDGSAIPTGTVVPDGIAPLGLNPDTPQSWINASAPTASTANGETTVTVTQTAAKAIATWSEFNVGPHTAVHFDQSAGTDSSGDNQWVILNRIDATATPSQIMGKIEAEGSVYLINPNGIVFGTGAQVDVHTLIASALDIGEVGETTAQRDASFLQNGLNISQSVNVATNLAASSVAFSGTGDVTTDTSAAPITVDKGAKITTSIQSSDNPGMVMLLGPSVENEGWISAPAGQVILAAGRAVAFYENSTVDTATGADYIGLVPETAPNYLLRTSSSDLTPYPTTWGGAISATNTGLIETERGNITLQGTSVENDGVLAATTSITRNGSIVLQGLTSAVQAGTLAILPDTNPTSANPSGESIPLGQVSSTSVPQPYIQISAEEVTQLGTGTIATGVGTVILSDQSSIVAPGASIQITGGQSVYVGTDSLIDAAGLTNTVDESCFAGAVTASCASGQMDSSAISDLVLPMSYNLISFRALGPEFADSPLQRNGALSGQVFTVDIRDTGTRSDGTTWVGTPLADVSGYVDTEVTENIAQLLTIGGTVSLATGGSGVSLGNAADAVVLRPGSAIDVSGGFETFDGGFVATTQLLGADGNTYSMATADPNISYSGVAGSFTVDHAHWGVSETFTSPLIADVAGIYEPGYIQGSAAGSINLSGDAVLADGVFYGQAAAGALQTAQSAIPASGALNFNIPNPQYAEILSATTGFVPQAPSDTPDSEIPAVILAGIVSETTSSEVDGEYPIADINPNDRADTLLVPATMIADGDFRSVSIVGTTLVAANTALTVASGGSISIAGPSITVDGTLSAPSGSVTLTANGVGDPSNPNQNAIIVDPGARLSTRGLWVNDTGLTDGSGEGPEYINGGTISLLSDARVNQEIDTTGGILVAPGATFDVTSGGYVNSSGVLDRSNNIPIGKGGSITLETYAGGFPSGATLPSSSQGFFTASVSLDPSDIEAAGFAGGGTLTISVGPSVSIDGTGTGITTAEDGSISIGGGSFSGSNPFGAFNLDSDGGSVTLNTAITLQQEALQANESTILLPTNGDIYSATTIGLTPVFYRNPVNLTLGNAHGDVGLFTDRPRGSGNTIVSQGASITAGAGASISITGVYQADVLGAITAPGGTVLVDATGNTLSSQASAIAVDGAPVADGAVYIGPLGSIDVSGETILNTLVPLNSDGSPVYGAGNVLAGGTVTLRATNWDLDDGASDSFGYVVTAPGSVINLDGARGTLDFLNQSDSGPRVVSQLVSSDAGSLTIDTLAGTLAGNIYAFGAGESANALGAANGILTINSPQSGAADVVVQGEIPLSLIPAGTTIGGTLLTTYQNSQDNQHFLELSSTLLDASAFDDVNLGMVDQIGSVGTLRSITFSGTVDLTSRRDLVLAAPITLDAGATVDVATSYLTLTTSDNNDGDTTQTGVGDFSASADNIDLQRGFIDAGEIDLNSSGDVRVVPVISSDSGTNGAGGLIATGQITITGREIYPTGGDVGVIQSLRTASGDGASLTIASNGVAPSVPLSAGGTLYLLANSIAQDGVVWAPGGSIVFGQRSASEGASFFEFGLDGATPTVVAARSISFGQKSITSVSLDNAILPWGGTVDGTSWYYDDPDRTNTAVTAPPAKSISLDANGIVLDPLATIDLSGGGDLYATEFVSGNGGTRDVLSTENSYSATSFSPSVLGNVALDNDVAQVYAILPGDNPAIAPTDVDMATVSGLGFETSADGLSVTLSGFGSLSAGTYTLLPAAYATLPGAYRVVVEPRTSNFQASDNVTLPDGSYRISGDVTTKLSGGVIEATSVNQAFLVQSSSVWQQYSEIDQADADTFFASKSPVPRLPVDAGQLTAAATTRLDLAGTVDSAAGQGGLGSIVDIAATNIEITDSTSDKLIGYVAVSADQLSALDAGSLLIGGTESTASGSEVITPVSTNIDIANDAAHPLIGKEIILVTGDTDKANGIILEPNAVITATGTASSTTARTITIGSVTGRARGDGALLAVTGAAPISVTRENLPGFSGSTLSGTLQGDITIGGGSVVTGDNGLTIDASATSTIADTAVLSGNRVELSGDGITVGAVPSAVTTGLILTNSVLKQFASASSLTLRSYAGINFDGSASIDQTAQNASLTLDGAALISDGTPVTLAAGTVTLENSSGATDAGTSGPATLTISANTIDFGAGTVAFDQFQNATFKAALGISASGTSTADLRGTDVVIDTPQLLAQTGADFTLTTAGTVRIDGVDGAVATGSGSALGGTIDIIGDAVALNTSIFAPSGTIALEATSGNVTLGSDAQLDAEGYAQTFFDVVKYAAGGTINLIADQGSIDAAAGTELDVAGSIAGGAGGTLTLNATKGSIDLTDARLSGGTAAGSDETGAAFTLSEAGSGDLSNLTGLLTEGGFNGAISITTGAGNLALTSDLTGSSVTLTANGGSVTIDSGADINASGAAGGTISLYGEDGVDIEGALIATGSSATEAGGTVQIGTGGIASGVLDPTYGYEDLSSIGTVTLGATSLIDVSGGTTEGTTANGVTTGGLTGGVVQIRVPLLNSGGDLNAVSGARIAGAHDIIVEGYATWSAADASTGGLHFDGIVDPAGWYEDATADGTLTLVPGTMTTQAGKAVTNTGEIVPGDYFTATVPNMDHVDFYQQTLMNFVEDFPTGAYSLANVSLSSGTSVDDRPGIVLTSPASADNAGDVTIASSWNLGAGGYGVDANGNVLTELFYRTATGQPGDLSLEATNNVLVDASLSDGFFQTDNTLDPLYAAALGKTYLVLAPAGNSTNGTNLDYISPLYAPAAPYSANDTGGATAYRSELTAYYKAYSAAVTSSSGGYAQLWSAYQAQEILITYPLATTPADLPVNASSVPTMPSLASVISSGGTYATYLTDYQTYLTAYNTFIANYPNAYLDCQSCSTGLFASPPPPVAPAAPLFGQAETSGGSDPYGSYLAAYQSNYAVAYQAYLNGVNTLNGVFNPSNINLDGTTDAVFVAPTPLVAPAPYGVTTQNATGSFNVTSSLSGLYGANGPANNPTADDPNPVMSADLVAADAVSAVGQQASAGSWSFTLVSGATDSVDPTAVQALSNFTADPSSGAYDDGAVTFNGHSTYTLAASVQKALLNANSSLTQAKLTALVPTILRTGAGSIDIASATDIRLLDTLAPAAIYTAGDVGTSLAGPGYVSTDGGAALNGPDSALTQAAGGSADGSGTTIATNGASFDTPDFGNSFVLTSPTLFAVTQPAYPQDGGNVTLTAQNDIVGVQDTLTSQDTSKTIEYTTDSQISFLDQFWSSWLLSRSAAIPLGSTTNNFDASQGIYNPGVARPGSTPTDLTAGQTTWWINFGSFDQGVGALGGGNVTITAGRDIRQFSASTASTGRVSGGLDASDPAVLNVTGGGNLTVTAGRNIDSGTYYVALGQGTIAAGGAIEADPSWSYSYIDTSLTSEKTVTVNPATILGSGNGQLNVSAVGSVTIGAIVNPTEIDSDVTLIVGDDAIANDGGASNYSLNSTEFQLGQIPTTANPFINQFNTMGPNSGVSLQSTSGEVSLDNLPTSTLNRLFQANYPLLPATVDVTALRGDVDIDSNFDMTNSDTGALNILAYTNLRLDGPDYAYNKDSATTIPSIGDAEAGIATYQTINTQTISTLEPLPGLVDTAFDPENPLANDTNSAAYMLLHANDESLSHIYALTGDITNGPVISDPSVVSASALPLPILADMPVAVEAGQDILNLQLYAQNTLAGDVTSVIAGRDLSYDLTATNLTDKGDSNGLNLIDVAGPGSVIVTAGRDLGPFPNNFNADAESTDQNEQFGIITTGQDAWTSTYADTFLASTGASVYAFAGIADGVDYQAVINAYINPANAASAPQNYVPALALYLQQIDGLTGLTPDQAFAAFEALPQTAQDAFVDQVFFNELKQTQVEGTPPSAASYRSVISTYLDPSSAKAVPASYAAALEIYVAQVTGILPSSLAQAFALFETLNSAEQDSFVDQILFDKLNVSGVSPSYARGYQIINTLFPGNAGYTQNNLSGGTNGANKIVSTGNIDLRSATIQTQHGGSVDVFVPGGNILLGSTVSRTIYNTPKDTGLITLQGGSLNVFTDQNITVNQSRILTEEGGDVLTWSSNGDILAGIGSKTSADFPPYQVLYDNDAFQQIDPAGLVTGAGIGALLTLATQDKTDSNAFLIAPRGTVDAQSAGLRSANNIIIAALHVANAENISAGGTTVGVPHTAAVNVNSEVAGNAAAAHAANSTGLDDFDLHKKRRRLPSVIIIDILAFDGK